MFVVGDLSPKAKFVPMMQPLISEQNNSINDYEAAKARQTVFFIG
jgi:hypothetical protein